MLKHRLDVRQLWFYTIVVETLTHRGWVTHIYVSPLGYHYFRSIAAFPLLTHWRFCSLALSHQFVFSRELFECLPTSKTGIIMYQVAHELCQLMQKQDSACSSLKGHDLPAVIKELANKAIIVCPAGTIESPHWDLNKKADIFQTTFWNTFS